MTNLLRQSVYSRLAGYEDVNDAQRLSVDPVMRAVTGKRKNAACVNTIGRFGTEILTLKENIDVLIPKVLWKCFIMKNRSLRLDYKATESWLFSFTKLIWGIFIFFKIFYKSCSRINI